MERGFGLEMLKDAYANDLIDACVDVTGVVKVWSVVLSNSAIHCCWRCWLTCIDRWRPFDHVEGGSAFATFLRERPVFADDAAASQLPIDAPKGRRWGLD